MKRIIAVITIGTLLLCITAGLAWSAPGSAFDCPTPKLTEVPTEAPTAEPTVEPTQEPPTIEPTEAPTEVPTGAPTEVLPPRVVETPMPPEPTATPRPTDEPDEPDDDVTPAPSEPPALPMLPPPLTLPVTGGSILWTIIGTFLGFCAGWGICALCASAKRADDCAECELSRMTKDWKA